MTKPKFDDGYKKQQQIIKHNTGKKTRVSK